MLESYSRRWLDREGPPRVIGLVLKPVAHTPSGIWLDVPNELGSAGEISGVKTTPMITAVLYSPVLRIWTKTHPV